MYLTLIMPKSFSLEKKLPKLERDIYGNMSNWQRSQLSRHLNRPHTLDFIHHLCTDFVELHGDRKFKDDPAIVGGPRASMTLMLSLSAIRKAKTSGAWPTAISAWQIRKDTARR